jgi:hypothetical protein
MRHPTIREVERHRNFEKVVGNMRNGEGTNPITIHVIFLRITLIGLG